MRGRHRIANGRSSRCGVGATGATAVRAPSVAFSSPRTFVPPDVCLAALPSGPRLADPHGRRSPMPRSLPLLAVAVAAVLAMLATTSFHIG